MTATWLSRFMTMKTLALVLDIAVSGLGGKYLSQPGVIRVFDCFPKRHEII